MIQASEASAIKGLFKNQMMNYLNNRIIVLEKNYKLDTNNGQEMLKTRIKELHRVKTFVKTL